MAGLSELEQSGPVVAVRMKALCSRLDVRRGKSIYLDVIEIAADD